jgi:site-specific DNA-methyltransferase (adenine-specific)
MKAIYQQPFLDLYHADCMELMKQCPDNCFDLAVVDPPYQNTDAIGLTDNKKKNKQAAKRTKYKLFENIAPENDYYIQLERVSKHQIVWGGNYLGLCGGVIVWQKNGTAFGEGEIAICSTHKSVRFFEHTWNGMIQQNMKDKEHRIHPTQKPVALYEWILKNYSKPGDMILDTHFGSGSIALAVHKANTLDGMNLHLTACEIDKEYIDKSIERIKRHVSQLTLFA